MEKKAEKRVDPGKLSMTVLYAIIALTAVIFGLFYIAGFTRRLSVNDAFNDPLFTDAVIIFMFVLLAAAVLTVVCGEVLYWRRRER